jgi:flagellar motor switch protein FliN/FliY
MTITTDSPISTFSWDWIEAFDPTLLELEGIPLSPSLKGFSREAFEKHLGTLLDLKSAHLEVLDSVNWNEKVGEERVVSFSLGNIEGMGSLLVPREELERLLLQILKAKGGERVPDEYLEPFWDFLKGILKKALLDSFDKAPPLEEKGSAIIEGHGLKLPVSLTVDGLKLSGSIVLSETFVKSFRRSELCTKSTGRLTDLLAKRVDLPFRLVVGGVNLKESEWQDIEKGDTLLLDQLSYPPGAEKGDGILFFEEEPVYRVRVKAGAIKIIEQAVGVKEFMADENHKKEEIEDLSLGAEELTTSAADEETDSESVQSHEKPLAAPEVPLLVRVEMGRFRLPIHQLLELRPGNVLKIDVDPRQGVDLVVEGKVIGRGELVSIGDLFGVRVTDLG